MKIKADAPEWVKRKYEDFMEDYNALRGNKRKRYNSIYFNNLILLIGVWVNRTPFLYIQIIYNNKNGTYLHDML